MTVRYLLDTNICIYLLAERPIEVRTRLKALAQGDAVMSVVTYAELCAGALAEATQAERSAYALGRFIERIPVLPLDWRVAQTYGRFRQAVPQRRRNALDRLIAAHAATIGATLVTNNTADFEGYPELVVENWVHAPAA